jgi:hypothetical protein
MLGDWDLANRCQGRLRAVRVLSSVLDASPRASRQVAHGSAASHGKTYISSAASIHVKGDRQF